MGIFNKKRARQNIALVQEPVLTQQSEQKQFVPSGNIDDLVDMCLKLVYQNNNDFGVYKDIIKYRLSIKGDDIFRIYFPRKDGSNVTIQEVYELVVAENGSQNNGWKYPIEANSENEKKLKLVIDFCDRKLEMESAIEKLRQQVQKQQYLNKSIMTVKSYL